MCTWRPKDNLAWHSLGTVHIWGVFVFETESLSGLDLANEVRLAGR